MSPEAQSPLPVSPPGAWKAQEEGWGTLNTLSMQVVLIRTCPQHALIVGSHENGVRNPLKCVLIDGGIQNRRIVAAGLAVYAGGLAGDDEVEPHS